MTAPLPVDVGPCVGDRYEWVQPDGGRVLFEVRRINRDTRTAYLRCHHAGRTWTRRHQGPFFPSMKPRQWTTADLLELIP